MNDMSEKKMVEGYRQRKHNVKNRRWTGPWWMNRIVWKTEEWKLRTLSFSLSFFKLYWLVELLSLPGRAKGRFYHNVTCLKWLKARIQTGDYV